jgi:hypothetical protein
MVLVGNGGTEERHDAVAQELIDRALVAVHLPQHQLEGPVHQVVDLFGVKLFRDGGESGDVRNRTVTCLRSPSSTVLEVRIFSARCGGV